MIGYVSFADKNAFLDSKGNVVEISKEVYSGIPVITGVKIKEATLGEKLPLKNDAPIKAISKLCANLKTTSITWKEEERTLTDLVNVIDYDEKGNLTIAIGATFISLGDSNNLEGKMLEITNILPSIQGKTGTLHLEGYEAGGKDHTYTFK